MLQESNAGRNLEEFWPPLPYDKWKDTYEALHMWSQIVGKIELELNPMTNHWWETALLVTPSGLTTYPIYFNYRSFIIEFNFQEHLLKVSTSDGGRKSMSLEALSVAEFYEDLMKLLGQLGIKVKINTRPQEVPSPIDFTQNRNEFEYNRQAVRNFHKILLQADRIMKEFRGKFIGKVSPVHFFWGSFDLAVTRFSGREAQNQTALDSINKEAYSHEVISIGFWPGSGNILEAAFYAYASPEPKDFPLNKLIEPPEAFYNPPTKGYILKYEDVRKSHDPDKMILDFFESTYDIASSLGRWDRRSLEKSFH